MPPPPHNEAPTPPESKSLPRHNPVWIAACLPFNHAVARSRFRRESSQATSKLVWRFALERLRGTPFPTDKPPMKKILLQLAAALLAALLLGTVWEPFRQSGNVWFALVPLLLLVRQVGIRRAWWLGCLTGFVSWATQLAWMLKLTDNGGPWPLVIPAWLGLSAVLALFVGGFAALAAGLRGALGTDWNTPRAQSARIALTLVLEPMLWAGMETLRANVFTGFAWNPLGLACSGMPSLLQPAAIGGAALVSALVVAVNGAVATLLERCWGAATHTLPRTRVARALLAAESLLPLAALLGVFYWGTGRVKAYDALPKTQAMVIAQRTEVPCVFSGEATKPLWTEAEAIVDVLACLPRRADLWLWPESATAGSAFPYDARAQRALRQLAMRAQTPLLMGGLYEETGKGWYNAALLFTERGLDTRQVYGKRHLVPFGEYIPFDKTFPWLQRFAPTGLSNVPGEKVTAVRLPSGLTVGPLICFEDTVASVARESVRAGARLLVNMSNDAWYTPSPEAAQHARQALLRCVETGVPMVRSTNGGDNTAIDAVGRAVPVTAFPSYLPLTERPFASYYLRWGEAIFGGPCATFALCLAAWLIFMRKKPQRREESLGPCADCPTEPTQAVSRSERVRWHGFAKRRGTASRDSERNERLAQDKPPCSLCLRKTSLVLLLSFLLSLTATSAKADDLIPTAGMALDDGNVTLAERTARTVLARLGISPEERAKAQEILIRAALAKRDWAEALRLIGDCPELPAERRLVFGLAINNGRHDYAKTLLDYSAARIAPDDAWGVAALRMALRADLELGKEVSAAERFAAVNEARGADARVRAENALAWANHFPNTQSRAALLRAARQADRGGPFLACALALPTAFATSDSGRADALAALDRLLSLEGLSSAVEARLALAASELATAPAEKVTYARRAVETAREEGIRREALAALGELLCASQETADEGLSLLTDAVRLNPSAPEAPALQLRIAERSAMLGKHERALKAYDRWLESYDVPDFRVRVRQGRARMLLKAGRPDEALAALTEAAELAGDASQRTALTLEAAEAAVVAKRYSRAVTLYRGLLQDAPSPDIRLRLARCCEAAGETDEARRQYAEVRDDPAAAEEDVFVAVMRLGFLLSREGRQQEAVAEYARFLGRMPPARRDALRLERGRAYHGLGELAKARDDFAAVSNSDDPTVAAEARFFLVLCLYGLGEDERARELAQAYVSTLPDSERIPDIVLWLAKSDFNRGDYAAAAAGFGDVARRWPKDARVPQALFLAARAAYQDQDYATAVERVGRLAQDFPQAPNLADARFLQCEALMELARHGEARDLLDMLIRAYPNAPWLGEAYGRKGDCLAITATDDPGRYALALEAYREALTRLGDNPDAALMYLYKIGRILERQDLRDDAAEQYMKLIYRVLNRPTPYSESGLAWMRKAIAQLRAIDVARGNRAGFETLLRRVRAAHIPNLNLPEN